jgi:O-methyltransferase involved in polyketide biosynthesis
MFAFVSVHAAARQSDIDVDGSSDGGIFDTIDPTTIINTNVTLSAGTYVFKNLIITNNSVLTLKSDTSPDKFNGLCITVDNITVEEGSSLYISGMGYITGQNLAAAIISKDTINREQGVKLSVGSDNSGQSVTNYPEQIRGVSEGCLAVAPEDLSSCQIYILMDEDAELITRLISFGLSEKEAHLFLHLFKYGPKSASQLAKSFETHREDVCRMLQSLIDKGVVISLRDSPTAFEALELGNTLETSLKKHETKLHRLEKTKLNIDLNGLEETLLIPLWSRAKISREYNSFFSDPKAIELVEQIDYDFSKIDGALRFEGILLNATRAKQFDDKVKGYITEHPRASVVNIGAGLDTTFYRVDNGMIHWYDLDLPNVIGLRRQLLPEPDRTTYISKSLFDMSWCKDVKNTEDGVFMMSGGVLVYFEQFQVKQFFLSLADNFPCSEIVFGAGPKLSNLIANRFFATATMQSPFRWALKDANEMTTWDERIKVIDQFPCFKDIPRDPKWGVITKLWMDFMDINKMYNIFHVQV